MKRSSIVIGLSLLSLVYVGFSLRFVNDPLIAGEVDFVRGADTSSRNWVPITKGRGSLAMFSAPDFTLRAHSDNPETAYALWHPPLYIYVMAVIFKLTGTGPMQARLIGLASFIGTAVGTYLLAQLVFRDRPDRRRIGLLSCLIFCTNPMAIQGSLIVDIDNTLLTLALTFCLLAILKLTKTAGAAGDCAIGLLFVLLLWIKLTTPLGLLFSLMIFLALRDGIRGGIRRTATIFFVGIGGFLLSWSLYTWRLGLPFLMPLLYVPGSFFYFQPHGQLLAHIVDLGFNAARLALWISPFLLLTWGITLLGRVSEHESTTPARGLDLLYIFSLVVLVTYSYVGRTSFSFPRYHYPLLPILSVIAGASCSTQATMTRATWGRITASWVLAVFLILLGGDPLLSTYHQIKAQLIESQPLTWVVARIAVQTTILALTPLLVYILCSPGTRRPFRETLMLPLAISTLSYCVALDVMHARANYLVRYGYGGTGTAETISFLKRSTTAEDFIFAPSEVLYGIGDPSISYPPDQAWTSEKALTNVLSEPRTKAFVYGIPTNSTAQLEFVTHDAKVTSLLETEFQRHVIGSYTIWLRRHCDVVKERNETCSGGPGDE